MVSAAILARASGKKRLRGSSRPSRPWSARRRTAAAVKCFVTEAMGYDVSAEAATAASMSDSPYPLARTGLPLWKTAIESPAMGPRWRASAARASTARTNAVWSGEGDGDGEGGGGEVAG